MYGIFTYIWLIFMVNVGKYTIHGSYGWWFIILFVVNYFFWWCKPTTHWHLRHDLSDPTNSFCGFEVPKSVADWRPVSIGQIYCSNPRSHDLPWWFQFFFNFHPYLGRWPNLTNIFQRGWNHQLVIMCVVVFSINLDYFCFCPRLGL